MVAKISRRWTIKGPVGRALKIEFDDFDLVPPRRYPNNVTHCIHDYIYVSGMKFASWLVGR